MSTNKKKGQETQDTQDTHSESRAKSGKGKSAKADPKKGKKEEGRKAINDRLRAIALRLRSAKVSKSGKLADTNLTEKELTEVCLRGRERFMCEPALSQAPAGICIFGDIHGQFTDLLKMLEKTGVPPRQKLLFLGDYVDRGPNSIEVVVLLTCYKIVYPDCIFMLRGNHETRAVNRQYGFIDECRTRYGRKEGNAIYTLFLHMFNTMPLAGVVGKRIFCCHGGISESLYELSQFREVVRPTDITDLGVLCDLIWADPSPATRKYDSSPRGISKIFGTDAVKEFCELMDLDMIIRGHQCVNEGYEWSADGRCLTVFSAPFYCQEMDNKAGIVYVDPTFHLHIFQFRSPFKDAETTKQSASHE